MSDDQVCLLRERGERLRQAAQSIGITHAAKAAGVPYTTLRDYMNGSEMKLSAVAALTRACGVSLDWLAFGVGVGPDADGESSAPVRGGHQVVIPWLSPQPDEGLRVGKSWLESALPRDPATLRLINVAGDAMAPTLREGDLVIVDTSARAVQGGAIFALRVEGDILLRRLERRLGGGIRALADNDRYPPQELQTAEAAGLDVVGEVVWSGGLPRG
jgi:hypothetical protein